VFSPRAGEDTLFLGSPTAALALRHYCSAFRHFPPLLRTSTVILFVLPFLVTSTFSLLSSTFLIFHFSYISTRVFVVAVVLVRLPWALSHSSLF
jgi:hypothetical protein